MILDSLAKRMKPSDIKRLTKADFAKPSFYNREKFDRDWKRPNEEKYLSTLEFLEELGMLYDGTEQEVSDYSLYPHITAIFSGLVVLPDEERISEVKKKIPGYMDSFFGEFKKEFSDHSTGVVKGKIDEVHLHFPKAKRKYLDSIESWLDYRLALSKNTADQLASDDNKKASAYFGRGYLQSLINGFGEEGGINELATLIGVNPIPDFYIGAYNGIKVGPLAVNTFDGLGKTILSHELGHHVGHFMEDHPLSTTTTSKFEKVRECLAGSHQEESKKIKKKVKSRYCPKSDVFTHYLSSIPCCLY